jgi:hypothetical protein
MTQDEWNKHAAKLLKAELVRAGVGYDELIVKLKEIDVEESYKGIASKVNRGTFSFAFFMQCMKALGRNTVRFEDN